MLFLNIKENMDIINFRVSPDGKDLELWVEIPEGPNYNSLEIDKIAIQDHKHYTIGYPDKPQVELKLTSPVDELKIGNPKRVQKRLSLKELGILGLNSTGLYFMYVHQDGIPAVETPCICSKTVTVGVAANLYPFFNKAVKYLYKYLDFCGDSRDNLIDIYIKQDMFLNAVEMEDYDTAIYIFDNLLSMEINEGECLNSCSPSSVNTTRSNNCKTCS